MGEFFENERTLRKAEYSFKEDVPIVFVCKSGIILLISLLKMIKCAGVITRSVILF